MIKNVVEKNKNIDVNEDKMNKLKEMFPNCFNINGEFDISVFEEELKANISIVKEGYGLNFLGKNYAKYVASLETETILVPDEENNNKVENENSENIYISGDNIDALKHLVKSYSGQIKCIYIDPPYNTGSDGFVYNDKFNLTIEKLIDVLDVNEDEAKRIYSMTNSKSNSHSAWLTFMYPRLYLARQLLTDDGIIFISIDDNEQSQLKLLCDSIFGEENIVSSICVNRTSEVATNNVIYKHEYMIAYSKNQELFKVTGVSKYTCSRGTVGNHDQTMPEIEFPSGLICKNVEDGIYNQTRKIEGSYENIENLTPIIVENGKLKNSVVLKARWRSSNDMRNYFNNNCQPTPAKINGEIVDIFFERNRFNPTIKKATFEKIDSLFLTNRRGSKELEDLNLSNYFDYPKSTDLLIHYINLVLNEGDIVLDFFSGSGTTAHSILRMNSDLKINKKIHYIMVQLQEKCNKSSVAYKSGYKTIDEIGQERIRRAAIKIKEETNADIDYGFKHYTIKDVNTNTLDKLEKFEPNYVISDGSILDEFGINAVLTTWMNEDGYGLTDKYEKLELEDYTAYKCQNTIYLLNWNISDLFIKALIEKYEKEENFDCNRIVMFGYSFTLNEIQTLKDNLQQVKNIKGINVEVITRY